MAAHARPEIYMTLLFFEIGREERRLHQRQQGSRARAVEKVCKSETETSIDLSETSYNRLFRKRGRGSQSPIIVSIINIEREINYYKLRRWHALCVMLITDWCKISKCWSLSYFTGAWGELDPCMASLACARLDEGQIPFSISRHGLIKWQSINMELEKTTEKMAF